MPVHIDARRVLGTARLAVGLGSWFAPDLTTRLFGLEPGHTDRFVTRLFGARETALAVALLAAPAGSTHLVASSGAVVDLVDAAAGLDERRRGNLGTRATVLGPIGALGFAALGVLAARDTRRSG